MLTLIFPLSKIVDYRNNPVEIISPAIVYPEYSWFSEFGGNINDKQAYYNGNYISLKEFCEIMGVPLKILKPISKEDFYRTNYTKEEAEKIAEDYYNYASQFAPSETE